MKYTDSKQHLQAWCLVSSLMLFWLHKQAQHDLKDKYRCLGVQQTSTELRSWSWYSTVYCIPVLVQHMTASATKNNDQSAGCWSITRWESAPETATSSNTLHTAHTPQSTHAWHRPITSGTPKPGECAAVLRRSSMLRKKQTFKNYNLYKLNNSSK